jgi:hypothetical protein
MFGKEDVSQLVECAKRALEAEDRYLTDCFKRRNWRSRPEGIRANINERYYQFIIWRELMCSFRWRPVTERGGYDLTFFDDESDGLVARAEIKGVWSKYGEAELPGIKEDMRDKLGVLAVPGVMLILTGQAVEDAKKNLCWLACELGVDRNEMIVSSFPTTPWPGDNRETEFAVIGFLVASEASPPSAPQSPAPSP